MSIADKLVTIAENQQRVYNIAFEEGEETGFNEGYDAHWSAFWDKFQITNKGAERTDYSYAFASFNPGAGWNATNFKPKYDLNPTNAAYMFYLFSTGYVASLITMLDSAGIGLDTSQCTNHSNMFAGSPVSEVPLIDLTNSTNAQNLFSGCLYLKKAEIKLAENTLSNYNNMFHSCQDLEDLIIDGTADKSINLKSSSKLTNASVQSVIDSLKDLTGATSQTLTLHAAVGAALTDEQIETVTNKKNWSLVY